jgi:hypothetical protein
MNDITKKVLEETWTAEDNNVLCRPHDVWAVAEFFIYEEEENPAEYAEAQARARVAACAPEALRLLLWLEMSGTAYGNTACCPECGGGEPYTADTPPHCTHATDCRWIALMKKAGLR